MPIYLEISRFHRTASIVGRGHISIDEAMSMLKQLLEAKIQPFAKLVDVTDSSSDFTDDQIARIADALSGDPRIGHGPVAFLIDPARSKGFAHAYAKAAEGKRAVRLFTRLREARQWLLEVSAASPQGLTPPQVAAAPKSPPAPWSDPAREGTVFRGERRRDVQIR